MCKLFFSLNDNNIAKHIKDFLAQTKCGKIEKNCKESNDGFGFAWVNQNHFELYKKSVPYDKDPDIEKMIPLIKGKMVFGHIREKVYGNAAIENTHPFLFENHIFMHNGSILNFQKHKDFLKSHIARKFLKKIQGDTDSEILFYLLLSFIEYFEQGITTHLTKSQITLYDKIPRNRCAVSMMFRFFEMNSITLNANIIYSNMHETIVTRYASGKTKYCPLYLNTKNNENDKTILITTKVLPGYNGAIVPENSMIKMKHHEGMVRIYDLYENR
jgi:predicted glutamine amidotransferase